MRLLIIGSIILGTCYGPHLTEACEGLFSVSWHSLVTKSTGEPWVFVLNFFLYSSLLLVRELKLP